MPTGVEASFGLFEINGLSLSTDTMTVGCHTSLRFARNDGHLNILLFFYPQLFITRYTPLSFLPAGCCASAKQWSSVLRRRVRG